MCQDRRDLPAGGDLPSFLHPPPSYYEWSETFNENVSFNRSKSTNMLWALLDFLDAWETFHVVWKSEAASSAVRAGEKEVGGVWIRGHLNCSLEVPRDPVGVLLLLLF